MLWGQNSYHMCLFKLQCVVFINDSLLQVILRPLQTGLCKKEIDCFMWLKRCGFQAKLYPRLKWHDLCFSTLLSLQSLHTQAALPSRSQGVYQQWLEPNASFFRLGEDSLLPDGSKKSLLIKSCAHSWINPSSQGCELCGKAYANQGSLQKMGVGINKNG